MARAGSAPGLVRAGSESGPAREIQARATRVTALARGRLQALAFLALLALLFPADRAALATTVSMLGEAYVYAAYFPAPRFTPFSSDGLSAQDAFSIWQRVRFQTDFTNGENLAFRLWLQVNNTPWGNGTYTVDNPVPALQALRAYLQFTLPGTPVELTAGKFTITLPQSPAFTGSIVLDTDMGALAARVPLGEAAELIVGYGRALSYTGALEAVSVSPRDVLDMGYASLALKGANYQLTPWTAFGLLMADGAFRPWQRGSGLPPDLGYIRQDILSLGYFAATPGFTQSTAPYGWAGLAASLTTGDFTLSADLTAGGGGTGGALKNVRRGLFADAAVEYGGLSFATPRLFGWYATGEDPDTMNGSERMPAVVRTWNSGVSYLFSTGQTFDNTTSVNSNPLGAWGFGATLDNIAFTQSLSSRITATYMRGTNDPAPLRRSVTLSGPGYMAAMGKDLTLNEWLLGLSFDHTLDLGGGLKLVVETGYAHPGPFQQSVWGPRFVNAARDSWKVATGFLYAF